jgi:CubicO group peptidase (beta-lactamase class C family)
LSKKVPKPSLQTLTSIIKTSEMMKNLLLFCLSALISVQTLSAQKAKKAEAAPTNIFSDIDTYIEKARKDWKVPGLGLAVVKNGKVIYAKGYGFKDVAGQKAVTPNTQFAIGSSTKAFTAFTVLKLAEEGKIDLNKPVQTYLPDFKLHDAYAGEKMTPIDLLCHRSGLPRHDLAWYGADERSREELFKGLSTLEPTVSFRGLWQYNNLMFMTAGILVEKMSGKTWEDNVREQIFQPLGMKGSNFSVKDMQKTPDFAFPYKWADQPFGEVVKTDFRNIDAVGPAGSINSSPNEMANWVIMHLRKGKYEGKQILSEAQHKLMFQPYSIVPGELDSSYYTFHTLYGLGWFLTDYRGHLRHEHGGNIDGFSANVALYPRDSVGIVVLTNMNGTGLTSVVRNYVADKLFGLPTVDWNDRNLKALKKTLDKAKDAPKADSSAPLANAPSHPLEDYAGIYDHKGYGKLSIEKVDKGFKATLNTLSMDLVHKHYDVFDAKFNGQSLPAQFMSNVGGKIDAVEVVLEAGIKPIRFERGASAAIQTTTSDLQKFLGDYELMGTPVKVFLKGETMYVNVPGQPDYALRKVKDLEFEFADVKGFSLKFEEADRKVKAVTFVQPNGSFKAERKK